MRAVLQRVSSASVRVGDRTVGQIGRGLLVLLGVASGDTHDDVAWMADKIANLRIFPDIDGKMNLSVLDVRGEVLLVSQFTLLGDCRKGRRPSFAGAMEPEGAQRMCAAVADALRARGLDIAEGEFRAMMQVSLVNEGPVTLILDSERTI